VLNNVQLASHFRGNLINGSNTNIGVYVYNSPAANTARIAIRPGVEGITQTDQFKKWLAENPVTLCYGIANPIEVPLSDELIDTLRSAMLFKGNTCISNAAAADMEISYAVDTKTYIDRKFAALADALLS